MNDSTDNMVAIFSDGIKIRRKVSSEENTRLLRLNEWAKILSLKDNEEKHMKVPIFAETNIFNIVRDCKMQRDLDVLGYKQVSAN